MIFAQITSLGLRCATLGARFVLMLALARYFEPADLGMYGLLTVTVGYAIYIVGFDFYTYSNREIIQNERLPRARMVTSHVMVGMLAYGCFCALASPLLALGFFPMQLVGWFAAILLTEYVAQELNRFLVALRRPLLASWVLFLRSGAWGLAAVVLMHFSEAQRTMQTVLVAWIVATSGAAILALWALRRMGIVGWTTAPDWAWIRRGLKVSMPFWVASLAIRLVFTADRYWFEWLNGLDMLGAYVFFGGVAATLMAFLEAAVFTFQYPGMIAAYGVGDGAELRRRVRACIRNVTLVCAVFGVASAIAMPWLVEWIGKSIYAEAVVIYPWLVAAMVAYGYAMIPHYALYAAGRDRQIIAAHVLTMATFCAATPLLAITGDPLLAIPRGLVCAFCAMLLINAFNYLRLRRLPSMRQSTPEPIVPPLPVAPEA